MSRPGRVDDWSDAGFEPLVQLSRGLTKERPPLAWVLRNGGSLESAWRGCTNPLTLLSVGRMGGAPETRLAEATLAVARSAQPKRASAADREARYLLEAAAVELARPRSQSCLWLHATDETRRGRSCGRRPEHAAERRAAAVASAGYAALLCVAAARSERCDHGRYEYEAVSQAVRASVRRCGSYQRAYEAASERVRERLAGAFDGRDVPDLGTVILAADGRLARKGA